ncbi:Rv1535 family protein [Mycobacterium sp. SP-6446]|uniref:Rv1535 family protein n=1 Tax=Mycobacterium sp. SP-6446 TaxID=1834162 RepID=UPI00096F3E66|nr:Rv1535 family protein [Mycobacterium sp. SP-6446]OMC10373.1 hypothetical protein A5736_03350 [Mycobacterium sp. SP-6446]
MTAALPDELATAAPKPALTVVRADTPVHVPAPKKVTSRVDVPILGPGADPLVNGAARLLSIPLRHAYAALWRAGVLEVRA